MRIAILGEASRTKCHIVKRALDSGYAVSVLASDGEKFRKRKFLDVYEGGLQQPERTKRIISGADAVLYVMSSGRRGRSGNDMFSKNLDSIIAHMENHFVRRFVILSHTNDYANVAVSHETFWQKIFGSRKPATIEDRLRQTRIDWTIVNIKEDAGATRGDPEQFWADLAKRMVSQITDVSYLRGTLTMPT